MSELRRSPSMAESGRLPYLALLGLGALDAAGYSVIAPVTPAIADATGAGPALIGVLVASFPAGMLAGFVLAGRAVGRRRPTALLLSALALLALGSLGLVVGGGLPAYFVARLVMGVGSGGLWIAVTFATLERWPGQEYLCMSRIYAAYSAGGLVGPALGAIGGIRGPFLAYLALVVLAVPLALAVGTPPRRRRFEPDRSVLRLPGFWLACVGVLFALMALGLIEGVLPLRLADRLRQSQIGWLYVGLGLLLAASAVTAGRMAPRRALAAGAVLVTAGVAVAGAAGTVPLFVAGLALAGVGIGLGETGATGVLLETVATERIVTAMVLWSQLAIVGYLAGPVAGGAVAQALGFQALGLVPLAVALVLVAAFRRASRPAPEPPDYSRPPRTSSSP
ncbi:MAG TPA: MFS transporter [Actinomycetes bacterium]|nr:MFS transporter [Actinomycetes bacterium]